MSCDGLMDRACPNTPNARSVHRGMAEEEKEAMEEGENEEVRM